MFDDSEYIEPAFASAEIMCLSLYYGSSTNTNEFMEDVSDLLDNAMADVQDDEQR